jgi:uncharacterized protein YcbK (DUF882 family)
MDRRFLISAATALALMPADRAAALPQPVARRQIKLANAHTGETFNQTYRDDTGPIAPVMDQLSAFLRDFHSGATIAYDIAVIDFLASVMDAIGATEATILSAYRTPETNAKLAATTFGVAENSQHLYGRALDVHFPARLEDAMKAARAMKRGGVGWYPQSGFFHIDSGPVRNWTLGNHGLGNMLLDGRPSEFFHEPLTIAPNGDLVVSKSGRQGGAAVDRMSLHRVLSEAARLARGQ